MSRKSLEFRGLVLSHYGTNSIADTGRDALCPVPFYDLSSRRGIAGKKVGRHGRVRRLVLRSLGGGGSLGEGGGHPSQTNETQRGA